MTTKVKPVTELKLAAKKKEEASAHASRLATFRSLNLTYTIKAFKYCADNDMSLTDLRKYSEKNHLDLIMLGTADITPDAAFEAIVKWVAAGQSMPLLHVFCLEAAKASGFFLTEQDLQSMGQMVEKDKSLLALILPVIQSDMESVVNNLQSMSQTMS